MSKENGTEVNEAEIKELPLRAGPVPTLIRLPGGGVAVAQDANTFLEEVSRRESEQLPSSSELGDLIRVEPTG